MISRRILALAATVATAGCASSETTVELVPVDGGALHVESRGDGPVVVLLHGGATDRRLWDPQFEPWSERFRVVRYDERGFGRSRSSSTPYGAHDDLAALLDHLDVDRAALVGLSLGGRIALDFTLEHPDRVTALALVGPGISGFDWSTGTVDFTAIGEAVAAGDGEEASRRWLETGYLVPAIENPRSAPLARRLALENAASWLRPRVEHELTPPALGRLGEVRAPTLLVIGERDVPEIHAIVARIAAGVEGAETIEVSGAGHLPNLERPAAFDAAVLPFLERHAR